MHSGIAVDAWLKAIRLVSACMLAGAQLYGSRCMALDDTFGVCVYAG